MAYRLIYTQRACKDIEKLDPTIRKRIGKTLLRYADNPFKYAKKLSDPQLGSYRFRIGYYRIIFDLDGSTIVVLRVGHRRDIYRGKN